MSFQAGVNIEEENYYYDQRHHRPLFCRLGVPRSVPINRHAVFLQSTNALLFFRVSETWVEGDGKCDC
jgi:hypothetical protein